MSKKILTRSRDCLLKVFIDTANIRAAAPIKATLRLLALVTTAIVIFVVASALLGWELNWCFREGRPMTWCSVFQLLVIGLIAAEIYKIRQTETPNAKLWHYLSIFFIYLACDDLLRLHEFYDHRLCDIFGWDKHGPADHIDDAIVGLYGLFGMGLLIKYWDESKLFFQSKLFFFLAACCAAGTVLMDFIDSEDGVVALIQTTEAVKHSIMVAMDIIEETLKTFAGVFFIGAFLQIVQYTLDNSKKSTTEDSPRAAANE